MKKRQGLKPKNRKKYKTLRKNIITKCRQAKDEGLNENCAAIGKEIARQKTSSLTGYMKSKRS